jgi:hypothetical protein
LEDKQQKDFKITAICPKGQEFSFFVDTKTVNSSACSLKKHYKKGIYIIQFSKEKKKQDPEYLFKELEKIADHVEQSGHGKILKVPQK